MGSQSPSIDPCLPLVWFSIFVIIIIVIMIVIVIIIIKIIIVKIFINLVIYFWEIINNQTQ